MSSPARTPAAGLPHSAWPVRPPAVGDVHREATQPAQVPSPSPQEQALDPRAVARASLAAGRNRSLWWTLAGIVLAVAVAFLTDAVLGAYALAAMLLVYAVVRATGPSEGPVAVTVRSKPVDVATLLTGAVALAALASVLPAS